MYRLTQTTLRAGLALALGLGLAWTASAQPARLDARLDRLGERVSVTSQQAAALDAIAAGTAAGPAASWTAAAQVLDVLTDEQVAQLREMRGQRGDRARGQRQNGDRARSARARRGGQGRAQRTAVQREAIRVTRDDMLEQRQALVQRLRDGAISDADFVAQSQALREDGRQLRESAADARRGDRAQMRDAAQEARDQALGLTDAQQQRLQTLRLDRIRLAPEPLDMRPYLDAGGQLDRSAYRQAQQQQRQQARIAGQSLREQTEAVYTERQRDLMRIHRAITAGGREGRRGGR